MTGNEPRIRITRELFDAVIFDLDGVITKTAKVHAAAWKELFDGFLRERAQRQGKEFEAFDIEQDYREYVDGKPRYQGVQSFLASRGIDLPYGDTEDDPDQETICGLGNKKNALFRERLKKDGVEVYEHAADFLQKLRQNGFKTAIVSSSKNCTAVLEAVGLLQQFDAQVDGVVSEKIGLQGKPDPDMYNIARDISQADPARSVYIDDRALFVEIAQGMGIHGIHHTDVESTRKRLKELGLEA